MTCVPSETVVCYPDGGGTTTAPWWVGAGIVFALVVLPMIVAVTVIWWQGRGAEAE